MKLILVFLFFIFSSISFAQNENKDEFVLTPFVGKIGLDTMTREEFIGYGKLQFNSHKIKVQSFLLSISCANCTIPDPTLYFYEGDSFIDERTLAMLKPGIKKDALVVVFLSIKFKNSKDQEIDYDKKFSIIVK